MLLVCFGLLAFALGGAHAQGCPPTPLPCSACACELDSNYLPTYYCNNMGLTTIPTCFSPETSLIDSISSTYSVSFGASFLLSAIPGSFLLVAT
eukprot:m.316556 g.316556  ORF g.316556 m.316556 type:complete len:94 (+) comp55462_c0_seq19:2-283(+)